MLVHNKVTEEILGDIKYEKHPLWAMRLLVTQLTTNYNTDLYNAFERFVESRATLRGFLKYRGYSILCFDGTAFRGYSSLLVLHELMRQSQGTLPNIPKPCEVFDVICGSSTGALPAIMFGRLRMSTAEALAEYEALGPELFAEGDHNKRATEALARLVERYDRTSNPEATLLDEATARYCKVSRSRPSLTGGLAY